MNCRFFLVAFVLSASVAVVPASLSLQAPVVQTQSGDTTPGNSERPIQENSSEPNIAPGKILFQPRPVYPKDARKKHIEGNVVLRAEIATDGTIQKLDVISGDPHLVPAALKAVRQWRYTPTLKDGTPVRVQTTITVTFQFSSRD